MTRRPTHHPLRATYTPDSSTGASTGRVDATHVHAETGQLGTSTLVDAKSQTVLTASGAEPAILSVEALVPPGAARITTTDGGTFVNLDVRDPAPVHEVTVERGDCGVTTPPALRVSTRGTGTSGASHTQIGDGTPVPPPRAGAYVDGRCDGGSLMVGARLPSVSDLVIERAGCSLFRAQGQFVPGAHPLDFHWREKGRTVRGNIQAESPLGGFLDFTLECAQVDYRFQGAAGTSSRLKKLDVDYFDDVHAPGECVTLLNRCADELTLRSVDLPPALNAKLHGPDGVTPGITLTGERAHKIRADIHLLKTSSNPASEDVKLAVSSTLAVDSLWVRASTLPNARVNGSAGNQFIYTTTDREETMFVKAARVQSANLGFRLQPRAGCEKFPLIEASATYSGGGGLPLDVYLTSRTERQRLQLLNLPPTLSLSVDIDPDDWKWSVQAEHNDAPLRGIEYAIEPSEPGCGGKGHPKLKLVARDVPAGAWSGAFIPRAASGKAELHHEAVGAVFPYASLEATSVTSPSDYYLQLSVTNGYLTYNWDLDGATGYEGAPYYFYCNTGMDGKYRGAFRYGPVGIRAAYEGAPIRGCHEFQVKLAFEPVKYLPFVKRPDFDVNGYLVMGAPVGMEILVGDHWWGVPHKLLKGEQEA